MAPVTRRLVVLEKTVASYDIFKTSTIRAVQSCVGTTAQLRAQVISLVADQKDLSSTLDLLRQAQGQVDQVLVKHEEVLLTMHTKFGEQFGLFAEQHKGLAAQVQKFGGV